MLNFHTRKLNQFCVLKQTNKNKTIMWGYGYGGFGGWGYGGGYGGYWC